MRELELAFKSNVPAIVSGLPGVGKTESLYAMFKKNNVKYITLIASIREPSDFGGLPVMNMDKGTYNLCPPSWVTPLLAAAARGQRTAIFLDEFNTAPPAVQAAGLRLIQERVVGETKLPEDCWPVAAINPPEIAANGYELSPPMANRFMHIQHDFDPDSFVMNFGHYWGDPPELPYLPEELWQQARGRIGAFLHTRRDKILDFPVKEPSKQAGAWPSPRSWDKASRILAAANDIEDAAKAIYGCVGPTAIELVSYLKNLDLPDPNQILQFPEKFELKKKRGDIAFAILSSVYSVVSSNVNKFERTEDKAAKKLQLKQAQHIYGQFWKVIARMIDLGLPDVAACWGAPAAGLYYDKKEFIVGMVPPAELGKISEILTQANIQSIRPKSL